MGSEPDSVSAWTEQHSIMNDPTFVGTGAAALLGCMAQFEQSLCAVSERYRPTIFLDPRENQHGWLVPSSLDKELWKAKIVSGSLPPPIGCVQKNTLCIFLARSVVLISQNRIGALGALMVELSRSLP